MHPSHTEYFFKSVLSELNIGHSIIGRSIAVGIEQAVTEMLDAMKLYNV